MKMTKRLNVHVVVNGRLVHPACLPGCHDQHHPEAQPRQTPKGTPDENGKLPCQKGFPSMEPYWIVGSSVWRYESGDPRMKKHL